MQVSTYDEVAFRFHVRSNALVAILEVSNVRAYLQLPSSPRTLNETRHEIRCKFCPVDLEIRRNPPRELREVPTQHGASNAESVKKENPAQKKRRSTTEEHSRTNRDSSEKKDPQEWTTVISKPKRFRPSQAMTRSSSSNVHISSTPKTPRPNLPEHLQGRYNKTSQRSLKERARGHSQSRDVLIPIPHIQRYHSPTDKTIYNRISNKLKGKLKELRDNSFQNYIVNLSRYDNSIWRATNSMPNRTFLSKEESVAPGRNPSKNRLTLNSSVTRLRVTGPLWKHSRHLCLGDVAYNVIKTYHARRDAEKKTTMSITSANSTTWECKECLVALHIPKCFEIYHTEETSNGFGYQTRCVDKMCYQSSTTARRRNMILRSRRHKTVVGTKREDRKLKAENEAKDSKSGDDTPHTQIA
ncbi:hypothetical protein WN48_01807 [Eufriesea mexicana]|uniref:Uncharacterized protein n=1 Tax=Eufriesea mexicana TaxID=516756 RepID=A0A310SLU2_9HYME|nr:hypothetical protein WN48_01807 [Eufriesea mexicana]